MADAGPATDAVADSGLDPAAAARMLPMLPCADVDAMAQFWEPLGLRTTYRQLRPNPYVALRRGGIDLHYYGMPDWDPEQSHSTCVVIVPDTEPLYDLFVEGLRSSRGSVPRSGLPRITRPRRRANNVGLSGFSLVDPAGNWIRVSRMPGGAEEVPAASGGRAPWTSQGGGPLDRAVENAVVVADSRGDVAQGRKSLAGALRRHRQGAPAGEVAPALAYLVELCVRDGDLGAARSMSAELDALAEGSAALGADERDIVARAVRDATAMLDGN